MRCSSSQWPTLVNFSFFFAFSFVHIIRLVSCHVPLVPFIISLGSVESLN